MAENAKDYEIVLTALVSCDCLPESTKDKASAALERIKQNREWEVQRARNNALKEKDQEVNALRSLMAEAYNYVEHFATCPSLQSPGVCLPLDACSCGANDLFARIEAVLSHEEIRAARHGREPEKEKRR